MNSDSTSPFSVNGVTTGGIIPTISALVRCFTVAGPPISGPQLGSVGKLQRLWWVSRGHLSFGGGPQSRTRLVEPMLTIDH